MDTTASLLLVGSVMLSACSNSSAQTQTTAAPTETTASETVADAESEEILKKEKQDTIAIPDDALVLAEPVKQSGHEWNDFFIFSANGLRFLGNKQQQETNQEDYRNEYFIYQRQPQ